MTNINSWHIFFKKTLLITIILMSVLLLSCVKATEVNYQEITRDLVVYFNNKFTNLQDVRYSKVKIIIEDDIIYALLYYNGYRPEYDENYEIVEGELVFFERNALISINLDLDESTINFYFQDMPSSVYISNVYRYLIECESDTCVIYDEDQIIQIIDN